MRVAPGRSSWRWAIVLVASQLAGCAGALPDVLTSSAPGTSAPAPAPQLPAPNAVAGAAPPSPQATAQPTASAASPGPASSAGLPGDVLLITSFTKPTVVLYSGESTNDGARVETSSLPVPLRGRVASGNTARLEIQTPSGPRWLARSEVALASQAVR